MLVLTIITILSMTYYVFREPIDIEIKWIFNKIFH